MKYLDSRHQVIDDTEDKISTKKSAGQSRGQASSDKDKKKNKKKNKKDSKPKEKSKEKKVILSINFGNVSLTEKMMLMDNLSTMLKAGLALAPALRVLHNEAKNKYLKDILIDLETNVENGQLLSKGMKKYPKVFSEMVVGTIEVGENTGMMSDSFAHLAAILKAKRDLQNKVFGALMYPVIVMIALVAVSIFLTYFVFPKLVTIFIDSNVELPFVLRAIQFLIDATKQHGLYLLAGGVFIILLLVFIFKKRGPKLWLHTVLLKIPFVGRLIREISLTRFAGNLHALLSAGLGIVEALNMSSSTVSNLRYRYAISEMSGKLEKGVSLDNAMNAYPELFPSLVIQLSQVGEKTGELESILMKISEYYDNRVSNVLANLSAIIEPVLLVIVGLAVGFIAISIIGPMYELSNSFA